MPWMAAVLAAGYVLFFWSDPIGEHVWSPLGTDMMHPDSDSFFLSQSASLYRRLGYPVFLEVVKVLFGTVDAVPRIQLVLLGASAVFLGWALGRVVAPMSAVLNRRVARACVCACVFLSLSVTAVTRFHAYVLAEGLAIPLMFVLIGLAALFVARPSTRRAMAVAFVLGLLVSVRPAAWFFLPGLPFLFFLSRNRRTEKAHRIALVAAIPFVLVAGIEKISRTVVGNASGTTERSFTSRRLFAKALMLNADSVTPAHLRRDTAVANLVADARSTMAPLRDLVRRAPTWRIRATILRNAEMTAEGRTFRRLFSWRIDDLAEGRDASGQELLDKIAWSILLAEPVQWAANARMHWTALWFLYSSNDLGSASLYASYVEDVKDSPISRGAMIADPVAMAPEPAGIVLASRVWVGVAFSISLFALAFAFRERLRRGSREIDDSLILAATLAFIVHSYFFGIAFVASVHARYSFFVAPLQVICFVLFAGWAMQKLHCKLKPSS